MKNLVITLFSPVTFVTRKVSDFFLYQYCLANVNMSITMQEILELPEGSPMREFVEGMMGIPANKNKK